MNYYEFDEDQDDDDDFFDDESDSDTNERPLKAKLTSKALALPDLAVKSPEATGDITGKIFYVYSTKI